MSITEITSVSQLDGILTKDKGKVSVIDFHAHWCGPCHAIAPTYEDLSRKYKNINFLKCDVDAAKDVASAYRVSAMPTFIFLKGTDKVDQVRGADRTALENAVRRHSTGSSGSSSGAFSGKESSYKDIYGGPQAPGLDRQAKVFLALIAAYLFFWYLSY
ncbi:thioredoxin-domain-containing protein [Armillaria novae-zelandiae]|uniref:Thioredoxin n=1 Tax=Armillaria novae-zelandiae TaxID=153914 RepID=A0AA39PCJ0_9AGAR|nr:thioredoxin-domain-containing protein [Armillaria novae-zelandiae]